MLRAIATPPLLSIPLVGIAQSQCLEQTLDSPVPGDAHRFGASVAVDGQHMLIGADAALDLLGYVYAYRRDPHTGLWTETQRIEPSLRSTRMGFGRGMDLDGAHLAVLAPGPSPDKGFTSGVFVFEFDETQGTWVEQQVIVPSTTGRIGSPVLMGDLLAIGQTSTVSTRIERILVHRLDPSTGRYERESSIESARLPGGSGGVDFYEFLDRDTLLVGDRRASVLGQSQAGLVHVLQRSPLSSDWVRTGEVVSPDPIAGDSFGNWIAWDGRQLAIGEQFDDLVAPHGGLVNVFEPDGAGGWVFIEALTSEPPVAVSAQFAFPLGFEDGEAWLYGADDSAHVTFIERWLRDDVTSIWRRVEKYRDPFLVQSNGFGSRVDLSGSVLVAGVSTATFGGVPEGLAYVYDVTQCDLAGTRYCDPAPTTTAGAHPVLSMVGTQVLPDAEQTARATGLPSGTPTLLLGSLTSGFQQPAGSAGPLCLGGSIVRLAGPLAASPGGSVTVHLDLGAIPTGAGTVAVAPGDVWHFQVWFRDVSASSSSALTNAVRVPFF